MRCVVFLLLGTTLYAAEPKLSVKHEALDPPKDLQPAIRTTLPKQAFVVSDPKGTLCTLWLRKEIPAEATVEQIKAGLTYRAIPPTTVLGAIQFKRSWIDFHQQEVDAGVYTLRLAIQPNSKDHEGTAPHREFCILSPAAKDAKLDTLTMKALIAQSGFITGGTHPVVMMLYPHPKPEAEAAVVRKGKAGQALTVLGEVRIGEKKYPLGFAFNLLGVGTDE
jgi:hypothetical protein